MRSSGRSSGPLRTTANDPSPRGTGLPSTVHRCSLMLTPFGSDGPRHFSSHSVGLIVSDGPIRLWITRLRLPVAAPFGSDAAAGFVGGAFRAPGVVNYLV